MKRGSRRAGTARRRTVAFLLCLAVFVPGQHLVEARAPADAYSADDALADRIARDRPGHPNVLVLMLDDANAADILFMPKVQHRLVAHGVSFTQALAPNPLCCPSRVSLLTGQYSHHHGVRTNSPPDGGFFVAFLDGQPAGCGAWRSHDDTEDVAEVKRVYVADAARGKGVARRIMSALEEDARAHGRKRIVLETGTGQPEAIALYEALGYERIADFGHYRHEAGVRSFGKEL